MQELYHAKGNKFTSRVGVQKKISTPHETWTEKIVVAIVQLSGEMGRPP